VAVLLSVAGPAARAASQQRPTRNHRRTPSATAPSITLEPASRTVTAGQTTSFSVTATGTTPLAYQWRMNGTAISGATSSSYTTSATTTSENASQFTVVVSNSMGSATSTAAVLTVNAAASVLKSSSTSVVFGSVNLSSSNTQSVTLTNAGSSSVTISNVMVAGAGFGASGVSSGLILSSGQTAALSATFDPAASGSATGSITITSNAANSPTVIALSGTGVAPASYSVLLSWTAPTSSVTGYNVYSSTVSGGPYTKLTAAPVAATDYTDNSVHAGNTYYYVVTAVNSENQESDYSTQASAVVP
jgi:Abnormal spindle-like microcephaly-assoc'd, ASPM-SPD-2-Hydin/Immunoglobulin I-set domain